MKKFSIHVFVIFIAMILFQTASASAQIAPTNIELTASPKQSSVGRIGVMLSGVELEDAFQRQSKSRGLNPAVFREEVVGALKELHPGTIQMEFPDLGQQLAAKFSLSGVTVSGKSASGGEYGLGEFLQLCAEVGSDPWLRIPSGTTPEQMREVVQYLGDSGSGEWSEARIAAGQSEPWTQVFGKIHIELGNESSGVTAPELMEAGLYAARANADFGAARQTTGFNSSKFDLMLSGAGASAPWSSAVLAQAREQDSVAIAADLPVRSAGASEAELYGALLAEPEAMDSVGGVVSREVASLAGFSSIRGMSVNVGRSQLSLTSGESDKLAQSWGAGLAQAAHLLQMMAVGVRYQNGAVLTENSLHCAGGSDPTDCRSSQFLSEALANRVIGGTMLQTVQTGANPSWSLALNDKAVQAHELQSFAFVDGGKVSLVLFNLSLTEALPATFSGQNVPGGEVQMAQIAPREITDGNENGAELQPSTQTLSGSDLSGGLSLPPYSMTVLSWEAGAGGRTTAPAVPGTAKLAATAAKFSATSNLSSEATTASSTNATQPVLNCPSGFVSSGASCSVSNSTGGVTTFYAPAAISGSKAVIVPTGCNHCGYSMNAQTAVNVQAFTIAWTFQPNEYNGAIVLQNNTNSDASLFLCSGTTCAFSAGAGYEAGFFQAFSANHRSTDHIFALEFFDNHSFASCTTPTCSGASYTGSTAQIYQSQQPPYNPNYGTESWYWTTDKALTSPVQMSSPATTQQTTTVDTYSATLTYDGTTLTYTLFDVTAGGSCPGASCFTKSWNNVNIPSIVGSNTAYLGITGGTNGASVNPYYLNSLVYTVNTPPSTPSYSTYTSSAASGSPYVAAPTFSPAAGTYSGAQSVTIASTTPGAYYCYTLSASTPSLMPQTDNSGGCTVGTLYSGPISVSSSQTLYAMAGNNVNGQGTTGNLRLPSDLVVGAYTIGGQQAATPVFSIAAGTYNSVQTVTISDATANASIYYTTNGTTPTTSSTKYTGPITVSSTETLEAIAVAAGSSNSAVASATYTINLTPATPTFSVVSGTYTSSLTVVISDATPGVTIFYTTNGSTPTTSSTVYTGPITISSTETLEAIAVIGDPVESAVATAQYVINFPAATPTFSIAPGNYTTSQAISISDTTAGTTIYYTTNGTTPTTSSTKYTGPITVSASETLEAIAVGAGYTNSSVATAAYTITPVSPSSPAGGVTYINYPSKGFTAANLSLKYGASLTGGMLQITDGGRGESRSAWFATPVPVNLFVTDFTFEQLNANADGMTFTIQANSNAAQGATGGGLGYQNIAQSVAVKFDLYSNSGEGTNSTGLYTDGASPTTPAVNLSSTAINLHSGDVMHAHLVYDGTNLTMTLTDTVTGGSVTEVFPVNIPGIVGGNTAYVGFTGGTGGETSTQNVLSWTYAAAAAAPIFSPAGGLYATSQTVSINDATLDATIYYTTDGSTPTTSSTQYTGPIAVSASETLNAIAVAPGSSIGSSIATASYNIDPDSSTYINYPSKGFTATNLSLKYGASLTGGMVQLTDGGQNESRSAWFTTPVPVNLFVTDFTFQQLNANADGMTFTIQANSNAAQGATGGGLGYQNIAQSVAVKFDLYNNSGEGNNSTGLYTDGASPTTPAVNLSSTAINLHSGDVMHAHLVYDGTNLTMTLTDTVTGGSVTEVFPVNIPGIVGGNTAYVGFTGGTGGETSTQNVLSWTYVAAAAAQAQAQSLAAPSFSPASGTYTASQAVTIKDASSGVTIYYTTDGSTPTASSKKYTGPLTISGSVTLQAIAVSSSKASSMVAKATYSISSTKSALTAPTFSHAAGTYSSAISVTIGNATAGATIYYTTNGTTPTASSTKYTGAITVSETEKLQAIAVENGYTNSPVASVAYTIEATLSKPTFSIAAGTYTAAQSVIISEATAGATIYYTTNGTGPTSSSTIYTSPIAVSATQTIKAIAIKKGMITSAEGQATYTIMPVLPAPTFSTGAGAYTATQSVKISDATAGATIYYTTNGTTPTASSTKYTGAINVSETEKLQAIAVETGHTNSPVSSVAYTIETALPAPTFSHAAGTYSGSQSITIAEAKAGTTIYYTTNGTKPTTSSTKYTGAITVSSTEKLEAFAVATGFADSPVASAAYTIAAPQTASAVLPTTGSTASE